MAKNKFEELLASIVPDEAQRQALMQKPFREAVEEIPELQHGYLRQSDYSRDKDALRDERAALKADSEYAEQQKRWYAEHWVPDAYGNGNGATKRELEKDTLIAALQQQVSTGGEMTFEDLNRYLAEQGMVKKADLDATLAEKKTEIDRYLSDTMTGYAHLITKAPELAVRHYSEFGEMLDVEALVKTAQEKRFTRLDDAWNDSVSARRAEKSRKDIDAKIEAAKAEGRKEALRDAGMNPSSLPVDTGSPDISYLQSLVLAPKSGAGNGRMVPDEIPFGRGGVADYAAGKYNQRDMESRTA